MARASTASQLERICRGYRRATWCRAPTCPEVAPNAAAVLRARNAGKGIDATMAYPRWDGTPPDYGAVVWALMPPEGPRHSERGRRRPLGLGDRAGSELGSPR